MARLAVILAAIVIGLAAPARAWCEATCIAPTAGESHCPSHDPADNTTTIAASSDACPVLESARPTAAARIDVDASLIATYVPVSVTAHHATSLSPRSRRATTVFERSIPLRI